MEHLQYQMQSDVLKIEGDRLKAFAEKYREVKVEISRKKITNMQYATVQGGEGVMNTMFVGTESALRR